MIENTPLVSILIPVHNAERFIGATLDSALAQTHPNCEIIVIDDGSTDNSASILRRYERHIRWWTQENAGQAVSRNRLLAASSGEFLEFLDADDILHPKKIATQIRALRANPAAGLALGAMRLFFDNTDEEGVLYPNPIGIDPWMALINMQFSFTSAGLWTRQCLESMGGWQEAIVTGHEYSRYFEILKRGRPIVFTDEVHTWYRLPSLEKPNPRPRSTTLVELLKRLEDIQTHLQAHDSLTPERQRAISEQRLNVARKMWRIDRATSVQLGDAIPKSDIGFASQLPNLPVRFLLPYKLVGFKTAQRLSEMRRRPMSSQPGEV